ncbi:DinB family protein [Oscillochloris sp. ZM17-4]|uniref:DinB family protein n=1 Tax=Oscillochloris sp. ZM17-4 TaxID=2866714 RepID=UPI001C73D20D|nr:DinB family protein [Oscillochloris sp. ZM17-4]MBX0328051.1 DinB family protein [Oscillochloris sp. ZM17-4]
MITPKQMADAYGRNVAIVKMQTKDMSHAESLIQLPFRANCMNWIVGHIITNRNVIMELLGEGAALDKGLADRYARDSDPLGSDDDGALPLVLMLGALERSQEKLSAALGAMSDEDMDREVVGPGGRTTRLGSALLFLYFHDTYHTGQTEIMRQASGKDDKVI